MQILPGLHLHYSVNSTLLTRYIGLYSIRIHSIFPSEIYCVLMLNNLPSVLDLDEIYDLKGFIAWQSSTSLPIGRLKVLNDLEFLSSYPRGIRIPHEIHRSLKTTMESDLFQLKKLKITEYSLILGIDRLESKSRLGIRSLFLIMNFHFYCS